ncbi:DUF3574 domain-containing protein [Sphingobacteriales bacterium UPWRP_1]|nr:DUF3574 domain-containing protein [Sphingobacteriales bacterium UPWRP_1]
MKQIHFFVFLACLGNFTSCLVYESHRLTRTELYFGLAKPDGTYITEKDWQVFADSVITPAFSEGSTIINGSGQWLGNNGRLISEPSKVVIVFSKMSKKQSRKIEQVRQQYKTLFKQEAVMRVDEKMRVGF